MVLDLEFYHVQVVSEEADPPRRGYLSSSEEGSQVISMYEKLKYIAPLKCITNIQLLRIYRDPKKTSQRVVRRLLRYRTNQ